mmetsp:Transcript_36553/g.113966  ORF Transcript_36553/g.113966 Transcript_36553/m.113966 type:complete len:514 (+) Transcript_36553:54-1595(+)|eukprot:CAMPEP_0204563698 /NCGR_PEP_ID=MMETSP0661-20131031/34468_1 /ASSEMBLY_ACC=CAM_ASM_000606 /TAXON_ID=109239 /ORGANISM="Alexandrium margalefi, Strain AMGDE01CS-322" /LENGTH=513 /DNA_ID=CAMNT_0051571287 /DNA_START=54 /DNA_END=1595 /DNA_ORIENTATION=-
MVPAPKESAESAEISKATTTEIDPDDGWEDSRSVRQQWLEYGLLCLCNIAWTIDASILPIFFNEFQVQFGVSQTSLSMLSTAKGWSAALFAFPCGFLGELLPRPQLIGLGMLFWASGLGLCSAAWSFEVIFLGRVLNGIGLGIVQPLLLSLVADKNRPTRRGSAFGSIYFVGAVCNTIFSLVATKYADATVAGIAGWRASVAVVSIFSAMVGLAILLLVIEPNAQSLAESRKSQTFLSVFTTNMPKVRQLFGYSTFVLILVQGAPGTAPWTVFPFFTQWLELSCFTHSQSAWIFSAFNWGNAFSNLLSGVLLNLVARRFPDHGPPSIANFSVASGIPFLALFFFILPAPEELGAGSDQVPTYFFAFLAFGLGAAMCGTVNKKVFSDIVPASILTYVYAIDQLIENGVGNLAGLAVGVLTDKVFNYDSNAVKADSCAPEEGEKLGMGMFAVCTVAWLVCFSVYLGMHCTYPKDRRRQLALRKELQAKDDSESGGKPASGEIGQQESATQEDIVI